MTSVAAGLIAGLVVLPGVRALATSPAWSAPAARADRSAFIASIATAIGPAGRVDVQSPGAAVPSGLVAGPSEATHVLLTGHDWPRVRRERFEPGEPVRVVARHPESTGARRQWLLVELSR
jgi:hypothetical protein